MTLIPHSCAVCSSFLQIEGLARGKEPVSRDWIELVEWKSTEADEVLGGDFQLARPLTTILQPRMLVMDLSSSNANPAVATAGDTVSLLLVASRSVYMPFVTIGGIEAAVELDGGREGESTFSGSQWMASRVITAGEGDVSELGVTVNFEDLFGNARVQKELSDGSLRVMVDSSRPQVSVAAAGGTPADGGAFGPLTNTRLFMTATFSEPITDLDASKIMVDNGSVLGLSRMDNSTYRFEIMGMGSGPVVVAISERAATDLAGNPSLASSVWTATYDVTPPEISMLYFGGPFWTFNLEATDDESGAERFLCRIYTAEDRDAGSTEAPLQCLREPLPGQQDRIPPEHRARLRLHRRRRRPELRGPVVLHLPLRSHHPSREAAVCPDPAPDTPTNSRSNHCPHSCPHRAWNPGPDTCPDPGPSDPSTDNSCPDTPAFLRVLRAWWPPERGRRRVPGHTPNQRPGAKHLGPLH